MFNHSLIITGAYNRFLVRQFRWTDLILRYVSENQLKLYICNHWWLSIPVFFRDFVIVIGACLVCSWNVAHVTCEKKLNFSGHELLSNSSFTKLFPLVISKLSDFDLFLVDHSTADHNREVCGGVCGLTLYGYHFTEKTTLLYGSRGNTRKLNKVH